MNGTALIFNDLLKATIAASAAIILILCLRAVLKQKILMRVFVLLWIVVLFRLLVVHSFYSPVSFERLIPRYPQTTLTLELNNASAFYGETIPVVSESVISNVHMTEQLPEKASAYHGSDEMPISAAVMPTSWTFVSIASLVWFIGVCLTTVIFSILYFNLYFLSKDMELSCDEAVVKWIGSENRAAYANALIMLSEKSKGINATAIVFVSFKYKYNNLKERVVNIMKLKTSAFLSIVMTIVLLTGTSVVFASNGDNTITEDQAMGIVLSNTKTGVVQSSKLISDGSLRAYQIVIADGDIRYRFLVNAVDGGIERFSKERSTIQTNPQNIISEDQAKKIAYDYSGAGTIAELCLENRPDGATEYRIVIQDGYIRHENRIDAYTGAITTYTQRDESLGPIGPAALTVNQQQSTANIITADTAQNVALDKAGSGIVAQSKLEYHPDGRIEYKIIIVSGDNKYDVKVNAYAGTVREFKMDEITTIGPNVSNTEGTINADRAKTIALEKVGGGIVTKCKLENKPKEGVLIYNIDAADGEMEYKVELNAVTGSILKYEIKYKP